MRREALATRAMEAPPLLDSSFLIALFRGVEVRHREAADFYANADGRFATTPLVLAEVAYMLHSRSTSAVVEAFHAEINTGPAASASNGGQSWDVLAAEIADRYADIGPRDPLRRIRGDGVRATSREAGGGGAAPRRARHAHRRFRSRARPERRELAGLRSRCSRKPAFLSSLPDQLAAFAAVC